MAITSSPQVLSAAADAYINAGATTRLQTVNNPTATINVSIVDGAAAKLTGIARDVAVTFTNIASNYANRWTVNVAKHPGYNLTFPQVTWDVNAGAPAQSVDALIEFYSDNGGTSIYGKTIYTLP